MKYTRKKSMTNNSSTKAHSFHFLFHFSKLQDRRAGNSENKGVGINIKDEDKESERE